MAEETISDTEPYLDDEADGTEPTEHFFESLKPYRRWASALSRPAWTYDFPKSWRWLRNMPVGMSRGYGQSSVARYISTKMIVQHRGHLIIDTLRCWNTGNVEPMPEDELWRIVRAAHHAAQVAGNVR